MYMYLLLYYILFYYDYFDYIRYILFFWIGNGIPLYLSHLIGFIVVDYFAKIVFNCGINVVLANGAPKPQIVIVIGNYFLLCSMGQLRLGATLL